MMVHHTFKSRAFDFSSDTDVLQFIGKKKKKTMSSAMASQLFKDFIRSLLSHIYGIRTFLSREVALKTRNETTGYPCSQTAAFRLLDSEYRETLDENARYWW
jgi:hypothetical protein